MKQISENRETIQIPLDKRWESFPQTCFCAVQYIFLLCTMSAILLWCTNQNKRRPLQTTSFERRTPLFLLGVLYVTCTGLVKKKRWTKSIIVVSLSPSFYSLVRFLLLSRSLSSCIPFSPPPHHPEAPHFLSRSNPLLDMLSSLFCDPDKSSRSPAPKDSPGVFRDNGMNAGMINPRGCREKTQECVKQGDNTLFSRASVGGAGIMVLQAGFADLQPLFLRPGLFTLEGVMGVGRGGARGIFSHPSRTKVFISLEHCFWLCNHVLADR